MWLMRSGSRSHAGMKMQSWGLLTQSSASKPTQSRRSAAFTELSPCWNLLSPASCVIEQSGQGIAFKSISEIKLHQNSSDNVIQAIQLVPEISGIDKLLAFPEVFQELGLCGETMS
jgi:hypothetical protein